MDPRKNYVEILDLEGVGQEYEYSFIITGYSLGSNNDADNFELPSYMSHTISFTPKGAGIDFGNTNWKTETFVFPTIFPFIGLLILGN